MEVRGENAERGYFWKKSGATKDRGRQNAKGENRKTSNIIWRKGKMGGWKSGACRKEPNDSRWPLAGGGRGKTTRKGVTRVSGKMGEKGVVRKKNQRKEKKNPPHDGKKGWQDPLKKRGSLAPGKTRKRIPKGTLSSGRKTKPW